MLRRFVPNLNLIRPQLGFGKGLATPVWEYDGICILCFRCRGCLVVNLDGLNETGLALWNGVQAVRDVTGAHEAILMNACRIADRLDELSDAIALAPLTVTNSRDDEVANPLLTEHRQQALAFKTLLAGLGVKELDVKAQVTGVNPLDELAERRAARMAEAADG